MPNLTTNSYLVDENGEYVLDESGNKIVLSTINYAFSWDGVGVRNSGYSRFIQSFNVEAADSGQIRVTTNKSSLVGLFETAEAAVGALVGAFFNSGVGTLAAVNEMVSDQISRGVSTMNADSALPLPRFNSYAFLPDITYYDDVYGLGDGTATGVNQDDSFNPEPVSGYTGRTDLMAMRPAAIDNTSAEYFTVFDSERLFAGETDWYFTDGDGNTRINKDHVITRITNAIADGYYLGRTDLRGAWLQLDFEHGDFIDVCEQAGLYWNHPEFDQGPWTALRQDIVDTINLVKSTFDCYVTWYAVPRMSNFIAYHRDTVAPFTDLRPVPIGGSDFTNSGFYSDVIPEAPAAGSWQENLKDQVQSAWNSAFGPVLDVLDGYHLRYYVNRSLNNTEYSNAGSARKTEQQWIQQLHNVQFCKDYNTANGLSTPVLPTTAAYTVGGGSAMGGYGQSLFTLPEAAGETTATTQVWVNDVETTNYTVTAVGSDAVVAISESIQPADAVRVNWHYGSSLSQSSRFDDVLSLETLYDNRLAQISSFDAKVTQRFIDEQVDGCMWWTSGIGLFVSWTLDLTRDNWDQGGSGEFISGRKTAISDWRYWIDLNYVTGGWLFDGDVNAQTAKTFWNNNMVDDAGLRDKWINTFTTYVNSHYAAPIADGPGLNAIPARHWANFDFDTSTWDDTDLPVEGVFFDGAPTVTDLGSLWQVVFTGSANLMAQPEGVNLIQNRSLTKFKVTLADGTEAIPASASPAGSSTMFFVMKPNGASGGDTLTGATAALQDFYPVLYPPNALNSSTALI